MSAIKRRHPRHMYARTALEGWHMIDRHECDAIWGRQINYALKTVRQLQRGPYSRQASRLVNKRIRQINQQLDIMKGKTA